jgi:hypothetical protein
MPGVRWLWRYIVYDRRGECLGWQMKILAFRSSGYHQKATGPLSLSVVVARKADDCGRHCGGFGRATDFRIGAGNSRLHLRRVAFGAYELQRFSGGSFRENGAGTDLRWAKWCGWGEWDGEQWLGLPVLISGI